MSSSGRQEHGALSRICDSFHEHSRVLPTRQIAKQDNRENGDEHKRQLNWQVKQYSEGDAKREGSFVA